MLGNVFSAPKFYSNLLLFGSRRARLLSSSEAKLLVTFCVLVFNLRSYHLMPTLGHVPQCIRVIGTLKRPQVRPPCSILNNMRTSAQPQMNLSLLRSNSLKFRPLVGTIGLGFIGAPGG